MGKDIKKKNFDVYNSKAKELIEKFNNIWVRKSDIDNAFKLYWDVWPNLRILELGCFTWREYEYIRNFTKNYTWIDISKEAIKYAQNNFSDWNFIIWDLEEYEFDTNFDIILAFASLLHSDKETTKKLFEKFYKILNKWWIVYISIKSSERYTQVTKEDEFWTRVYYYYSLEEYKNIAWDKFEVIYEDQYNFKNQDWFTIAFKKI